MRNWVLGIVTVACLFGIGCAKSDNPPAKVAAQPTVMPPAESKNGQAMPTVTEGAGGLN